MCVDRCCRRGYVLTGVAGESVWCVLAGVAGEGVWCVLTGVAGKRVSGVCWQVLQKRGVSCVGRCCTKGMRGV